MLLLKQQAQVGRVSGKMVDISAGLSRGSTVKKPASGIWSIQLNVHRLMNLIPLFQ